MNSSMLSFSVNGLMNTSPFMARSYSFKLGNLCISKHLSTRFVSPLILINGYLQFSVQRSNFKKYLSNTMRIENNCQNLKVVNQRKSFSSVISDTLFENIESNEAGGSIFFNNEAVDLIITSCHFINSKSTGIVSLGTRPDAGGGGFCSLSATAKFSKLCFTNCVASNVGGAFYSQVPTGSKQYLNDSSIISCKTFLHNGWSSDWGYISNNNINGTSIFASNGNSCGYRITSDGCCVKYSHFQNCTANGNTYGIIGDYSPNSMNDDIDDCNFISNRADLSIVCLHSDTSIITKIRRSSFIDNIALYPVTYYNVEPQFINCWGQSSFLTANGIYTNCNFNNQKQTHSFKIDFCTCNEIKNTFIGQRFQPDKSILLSVLLFYYL